MSNYLDNLIAQSHAAPDAVLPRPAARFELAPALPGLALIDVEGEREPAPGAQGAPDGVARFDTPARPDAEAGGMPPRPAAPAAGGPPVDAARRAAPALPSVDGQELVERPAAARPDAFPVAAASARRPGVVRPGPAGQPGRGPAAPDAAPGAALLRPPTQRILGEAAPSASIQQLWTAAGAPASEAAHPSQPGDGAAVGAVPPVQPGGQAATEDAGPTPPGEQAGTWAVPPAQPGDTGGAWPCDLEPLAPALAAQSAADRAEPRSGARRAGAQQAPPATESAAATARRATPAEDREPASRPAGPGARPAAVAHRGGPAPAAAAAPSTQGAARPTGAADRAGATLSEGRPATAAPSAGAADGATTPGRSPGAHDRAEPPAVTGRGPAAPAARAAPLPVLARRSEAFAGAQELVASSERRPDLSPEAAPAPPAPTIQVTIGRIEVRAAQGPARPTPPRPTAAESSLDAYLRRRERGRP